MHLRTALTVKKSLTLFHHETSFLTLGSCFAEETAQLLKANKFNVCNPFGTAFNPESIAWLLRMACEGHYEARMPLQQQEVWLDYRFHSSLFGYSEEELYRNVNQAVALARQQLQGASPVCIITLGTAWVYRHLESQQVVSNCHKQPAGLFQKELLPLERMLYVMQHALEQLFLFSPQCKVILTLSPVRHLKDGLEDNQVSKSLLRVLCHQLAAHFPAITYFPAYELLLDDLRDYRFYASDLIHPNELAVAYIWEKFSRTFFDDSTQSLMDRWQKISQQLRHRPLHDQSKAYKKFLEHTLQELMLLNRSLDLSEEIGHIHQQLSTFSHDQDTQ